MGSPNGTHGLGVGRQVNARAGGFHVVVVHVSLRLPLREENASHVLRIRKIGHEGVAVVVVACVLLIEPGRVGAFILRPELFVVPVGDHDLAIGVEAGDFDEDDVVQYAPRLFVLAGEQIVSQLRRHLRAANLGGVHTHRLHDDDLALLGQGAGLRFGESARVAQASVDLAVSFQLRQVGGGRDDDHQERVALRSGPHVHHLHAASALFLENAVVVDDFVPARDFPVGAELKAEELFGGSNLLGCGEPEAEEGKH